MLCPACSTEVAADAVFCPKCGKRLEAAAPAAAATTPAARMKSAPPDSGINSEPEQQLWHGSYSPKAMVGSWLLAGIVTIGLAVVCVLVPNPIVWLASAVIVPVLWFAMATVLLYQRLGVDYMLTTQRFVHQVGIFRRLTNRIEVIDIDDVSVEQSFVERMLGVGTIKLLSSDISDPKLILRGIDDVKRIATLIDDARREERRKRAVYMETV